MFVKDYYDVLNSSRREHLASYYVKDGATPSGKALPTIIYNGNVIPGAQAMQDLYEKEMPKTRYEAQSYDAQVMNPGSTAAGASEADIKSGRAMTILVSISGYVKYGELRSAVTRGFSETFILVPNPDQKAQ